MKLLVALLYLNCGIFLACAQNDGRYRPINSFVTQKPVAINDGRYRPSNDGRYNPANDGKYRPSNDGKYVHIGDKDRGQYTGGGGEYTGGGGEYTGGGGAYDGGFGKYSGGSGQTNAGASTGTSTGISTGISTGASAGANTGLGSIVGLAKYSTTVKPISNVNAIGSNGWRIIRDERTEDTDGYHYLYETENGILADESGRIENLAPNEDGLRSKGFYQYTGDDGVLYRVDYVADNNGFVPQGAHIPKTPPAIQKLLDYLASQSQS